jgi:hypothetical protein
VSTVAAIGTAAVATAVVEVIGEAEAIAAVEVIGEAEAIAGAAGTVAELIQSDSAERLTTLIVAPSALAL